MLSLVLAAAFLLHGTVHDAAGHAVPGARVTWNGTHSAAIAADGTFVVDPGIEWPDVLFVSAEGFGTRLVDVPRVPSAAALDVVLRRGATLNVAVDRHGERRPLEVFVGIDQDGPEPRWIKSRRIVTGRNGVTIPDLARGTYLVQLRGPEPLQQFTTTAVVADGDVRTVRFDPVPRRLRARIVAGTKAVPNADVLFHNFEQQWKGMVHTDANGRIDAPLWQGGEFELVVHRIAGTTPVFRVAAFHGGPEETTIVVPDHVIRGTAVDEHGHPLSGASVILRTKTDAERKATVRAHSDANGKFAFDGVDAGSGHRVHVVASGYLVSEPLNVTVDADRPVVPVHLVMSSGYARDVVVRWRDGSPVEAATVLCVGGSTIRSRSYTENDGRGTVATPLDTASVLYVIPREGSIAVYHLPKAAEETSAAPVTITVPPPAASLRVATLTTTGAPLGDVSLLLRLNGEIIPPEVAKELERQNGVRLQTAEDGQALLEHIPVGTYELWPYRGDAELAAWMETVSVMAAPISVKVVAGENTAQVRFRARI
jgi:hypothetical protein